MCFNVIYIRYMKRLLLLLSLLFVVSFAKAQTRYAFVDTEYILNKIPEYTVVKNQIDALSGKWQHDLDSKNKIIDSLYNKLKVDQVFLSPSMLEKRKSDIANKQRDLKTLERLYFGEKGELYKRKQELLKPILDDVFDAIKEIATIGNYGAIYDRAAGLNIVYFNPRLEKSDDVLEKLGYKTN